MPQDTRPGPGPGLGSDLPYFITSSVTSLSIILTSSSEDNTEMHDIFETPTPTLKALRKNLLSTAKLIDQLHTAAAAIVTSQNNLIINEPLPSLWTKAKTLVLNNSPGFQFNKVPSINTEATQEPSESKQTRMLKKRRPAESTWLTYLSTC